MRTLIATAIVFLAAGCSPYQKYCVGQVDCEGGAKAEVDECVQHHKDADEEAVAAGCSVGVSVGGVVALAGGLGLALAQTTQTAAFAASLPPRRCGCGR